MARIASGSNGRCLDRGISVMRLALGYETGLPEKWSEIEGRQIGDAIRLAALAFPDRDVRAWCSEENSHACLGDIVYMGETVALQDAEWLMSFVYGDPDESESHFVIGHPAQHKGAPHISLVIGVRTEVHDAND